MIGSPWYDEVLRGGGGPPSALLALTSNRLLHNYQQPTKIFVRNWILGRIRPGRTDLASGTMIFYLLGTHNYAGTFHDNWQLIHAGHCCPDDM
jgi:hypothetical protein